MMFTGKKYNLYHYVSTYLQTKNEQTPQELDSDNDPPPKKKKTLPADVLPNDSEDLLSHGKFVR